MMNEPTLQAGWSDLQEAYRRGELKQDTPEIAAIFEQIKHLRAAEQSLRSIRRNLELDNVPSMDEPAIQQDAVELPPAPENDFTRLMDAFLALRDEKDHMARQLAHITGIVESLERKVHDQEATIASLQGGQES